MKQTLTFIPPVVDSTQSSIHTEAYEKSNHASDYPSARNIRARYDALFQ